MVFPVDKGRKILSLIYSPSDCDCKSEVMSLGVQSRVNWMFGWGRPAKFAPALRTKNGSRERETIQHESRRGCESGWSMMRYLTEGCEISTTLAAQPNVKKSIVRSEAGQSEKHLVIQNHLAVVAVTSIPACRKTLRAGKFNWYLDFKHYIIYVQRNISYHFW